MKTCNCDTSGMIIILGKRLAFHDKHFVMSCSPYRAAQIASRGDRQTHAVPRKFQAEENQKDQQLADDASRFT